MGAVVGKVKVSWSSKKRSLEILKQPVSSDILRPFSSSRRLKAGVQFPSVS